MRRAIVTLLVLLSFGLKAQVYQAMPQAGYGPVKRMLFDSVLTIPLNINQLRNITGGRDAGQIRYNVTDSGLYVFSGFQWIKANLDSTNISNRINGKLNISDTAAMLLPYMKFIDTVSLSNRINLRVKYSDTAAMLLPYLRKLDTASLSRRIDEKQNIIKLTTNFKSGAATLIRDTLNIPKYSDTLSDAYVPYVGANKDVDLGVYDLTGTFLTANAGVEIQDNGAGIGDKVGYTSLYTSNEAFNFRTSRLLPNNLTKSRQATFLYPVEGDGYLTTFNYNLPVRTGTLALVEDTVNLSNRINLKADKATTLTINGVTYNLSANRSWTIPVFDSTSISNRINLKLNISDTAAMLSPYLRKADTSSLSNRIDLRVKYSDTAAMLSPYLKSAVTSVGLSMPSAFTVTNSPVTSTGTLTVTGAGNTSQYIDGTGALQTMQGIVTEVETLVKEVYNETGATLTKGTVVYINGGHGNLPTVTKAAASSDSLSAQTFGLVKADISDNSNGYVIVIGDLIDMPTSAFLEGTQLYLSPTAGLFTSTKQYAPSHLVYVGVVTRSHPTQGVISVKIQNGYEMDELHNVSAQSPSNNSLLQYKTATSLWTKVEGTTSNIAEGTNLYYTDARVSNKMNYTDTVSLSNRINAKADALSGTTNTVPKFTSSTTIGNSNIKDDGNAVTINATAGSFGALQVGSYNGNILMNTTNSNGGLIFQNTSSSNKLWDFSSDNNDLVFNESNVNPVMKLKAGGNVVISNLSGTGTRMVVADANGVLSSQAISSDTTSLSNRINLKLNISDTASMLSPYLRKADTSSLSNRINLKLNISDTASMLSGYQSAINSKQPQLNGTGFVKASGTSISYDNSTYYLASNPNGYTSNTGTVTSVATGLGLSGGTITTSGTLLVDTASASILSRQRAANTYATTSSLSGYLPLTGGTLTGALGGTSASFSGLITSTVGNSGTLLKSTNATTSYQVGVDLRNTGGVAQFGIESSVGGTFVNGSTAYASIFGSGNATDAQIQTNGTVRLSISSTGTSTFETAQGINATFNSTNASGGYINFKRSGTNIGYLGNSAQLGIGTLNALELRADNDLFLTTTSGTLAIKSTGNVGIGTTSPAAKLDILGANEVMNIAGTNATSAYTGYYYNTSTLVGYIGNGTSILSGAASSDFIFRSQGALVYATGGNNERMKITSGGNVLIGTGTDNGSGAKLQVAGLATATGSGALLQLLGGGTSTQYQKWANGGGNYFIGISSSTGSGLLTGQNAYSFCLVTESARDMSFGTQNAERMRIASTGAVTINNLGTGTVTASSGTLSTVSDSSYKIADGFIEDALPSVMNLKPRYFYWKDKSGLDTTIRQLGFYAQEVNSAIGEEAANTPKENAPWGITDRSLIAYLTKAIQELSVKNEALIKRIETLENK